MWSVRRYEAHAEAAAASLSSPSERLKASFAAFEPAPALPLTTIARMFGAKRADPQAARKELRNHLTILGIWILAIRLTPEILDKYQQYNH